MKEIAAILFDLDGTLIDSEVIWVDAVELALADRGIALPYQESVKLVYGRGWKDIYLEVEARFPSAYSSIDEMGRVMSGHFERIKASRDIRIPGSIKLLRDLSVTHPVGIVSGSLRREIAAGIKLMGIDDHVVLYLGAEDYFPGKPDPTCFLTAAQRFGVKAEHCLVFEDSAAGVTAAKRAGMHCVGLQRRDAPVQDLNSADLVLEDLSVFDFYDFTAGRTP